MYPYILQIQFYFGYSRKPATDIQFVLAKAGHWYSRGIKFGGKVYTLLDMGVQGYDAVINGSISHLKDL